MIFLLSREQHIGYFTVIFQNEMCFLVAQVLPFPLPQKLIGTVFYFRCIKSLPLTSLTADNSNKSTSYFLFLSVNTACIICWQKIDLAVGEKNRSFFNLIP